MSFHFNRAVKISVPGSAILSPSLASNLSFFLHIMLQKWQFFT